MTVADFHIGQKFKLRRSGWEKAKFIVLSVETPEGKEPYLRVQDLNEPSHGPMWIREFQLALYVESDSIAVEEPKREVEQVEVAMPRPVPAVGQQSLAMHI